MKEYELTVLIHPDLEMDIEKPLGKVRDIIKANGGEVVKETSWGKKKLAYRIKGEDFAVYVHMEINLPPTSLDKLSNTFNITDEILRYLVVKTDEKIKAKLAASKARQEKTQTEEEESDGESN